MAATPHATVARLLDLSKNGHRDQNAQSPALSLKLQESHSSYDAALDSILEALKREVEVKESALNQV